jgi:putative transposase
VVTTAGPVELERPRVRNAREFGFESRLLGRHVARTQALESLIICSFLRGLSVRDVEAALEETFEEPVIGKSTVARVCQDTRERYRRWCERRLDEHDLVYLFCDALYLKLRPDDEPAEGVLVAWGVTLEGRKVLLGLQLGSRESYENWLAFGRGLIDRGLRAPALIIADGAPGSGRPRASCGQPPRNSAAPCTRSATSPAICPNATTASSRPAGGRSSTTPSRSPTRAAASRPS